MVELRVQRSPGPAFVDERRRPGRDRDAGRGRRVGAQPGPARYHTGLALLRAYRLGHAWFWDRWTQLLRDRLLDAEAFIEAQECSSAFLFAYIDHMSAVLVDEYGSERERVVRGAEQLRAETVRFSAASPSTRRSPSAGWATSCVATTSGCASRTRQRAARPGARPRARRRRCSVRASRSWCCRAPRASTSGAERSSRPGSTRSMPMRPRRGSSSRRARRGTRSTASGARTARRSRPRAWRRWRGTRRRRSPATSESSRLLLLAADLSRARDRSSRAGSARWLRRRVLARLRETVLAFLIAGGSATRVAKQLFVHQNTVAYRVKRAEELLGRRVMDEPVELTCALVLVAVLGCGGAARGRRGAGRQ